MVKRINLAARDWLPEPIPPGATQFTTASVTAAANAIGSKVVGTDTNTPFLIFGDGVVAIGVRGNALEDISLGTVSGTAGIGIVAGSNPRMTYSEGEWMVFLLPSTAQKFGITLNDFGKYTQSGTEYTEQVLLVFYSNDTPVKTFVAKGCNADGGLASFSVSVGATFNRVYVFPYPASTSTATTGDTGIFVSEIRSCSSSAPNSYTALSSAQNTCADPSPI